MTARDPDVLIRAYLDEGMSELPDRAIDAIAADVHVTRQRARSGSWRFPLMSRTLVGAAAAVVAVALAGSVWLGLSRPSSNVGGASPSSGPATSSAAPSGAAVGPPAGPSVAGSASSIPPSDLAVGSPFPVEPGIINGGATYHSVGFSQPLAFTMATYAANKTADQPGGYFNASAFVGDHGLHMFWGSGAYGLMILDDVRFPADLCQPTADVLADIPATPDAVGQWLHGSMGMTVTDLPNLTVEGRTARAWDVTLTSSCTATEAQPDGSPDIWFQTGEQHRIYAVPTGSDTILVITWPASGLAARENPETDALVKSLRFH